jgi:hypothetical protein
MQQQFAAQSFAFLQQLALATDAPKAKPANKETATNVSSTFLYIDFSSLINK